MSRDTYKTYIDCECGYNYINIEQDFVGYMGSRPCYESRGECPKCGKTFNNSEINKRFGYD